MELRQLRYLVAVTEEANFTRAAEKVFVSQSALSQQIQILEQELGTNVVDRSKKGVRLTAAGEILYHHAQRIMLELEQAEVAIRELEGLQRGELRIGVVQTVNDYLIPALVNTFSGYHPQIRLLVDELPSDEIESKLLNGELQVGLGFVPAAHAVIATEILFEEQLMLIVRDDHPFAKSKSIAVEAIGEMPMVMLSNTFCTRRLWEENALLAHAHPQVLIEMNTVSSILAVVEKTGLATVLPSFTLTENQSPRLVGLKLYDPTPSRQVGLLWHNQSYLCSASRAFIGVARELGKQFTEGLI